FCFFFQAEDGIRYRNVTGVQTCALPIWFSFSNSAILLFSSWISLAESEERDVVCGFVYWHSSLYFFTQPAMVDLAIPYSFESCRSEERRVGKECGSRW